MLGVVLGMAIAAATQANPSAAVDAALQWVALVDEARWNDSWEVAGSLFQSNLSKERWASTVEPVREPLGGVISRQLKATTKTSSLPGAPEGEYEIIQFDTGFANKKYAVETVVLAREASGWKVDGYFVR